eukprot:NODE_20594_length_791_cov_3.033133.p1 GENE.NODE_20594_length_791_cov_3.033133~~NODE_20594_length_791_cov_3.033133.p1  ORF type:complete len:206 (-),score=63.41 NODE_20594_length_791_cov_3.033133:111-728(-)
MALPPGCEMFAMHQRECQEFAQQAKQELERLRAAPESERLAINAAVHDLLKLADASMRAMEMEVRTTPAAARPKLAGLEESLRAELRGVVQELKGLQRSLLFGDKAAGGGGGGGADATDKLFLGRDERRRAVAATEQLRKGTDRLNEAKQMALESEKIGDEAMKDLLRQRETIQRMKSNTDQLDQNLRESDKTIKSIEQQGCMVM